MIGEMIVVVGGGSDFSAFLSVRFRPGIFPFGTPLRDVRVQVLLFGLLHDDVQSCISSSNKQNTQSVSTLSQLSLSTAVH